MSIKTRFSLVIGILLLAFLGTLILVRKAESEALDVAWTESRSEMRRQMDRIVDLHSLPLNQMMDDFRRGSLGPASGVAKVQSSLESSLDGYGIDAAWIIDEHGGVVAQAMRSAMPITAPAELPAIVSTLPPGATRQFFDASGGDFVELYATKAPSGVAFADQSLIAARLWDANRMDAISRITDSHASIQSADQPSDAARRFTLDRPLLDWHGNPIGTLRLARTVKDPSDTAVGVQRQVIPLFVAFGILLLAAIAVCLRRWIFLPLDRISESLKQDSTAPIQTMMKNGDELARVARLAEHSFAQKRELRREVEERLRAEESLRASEANLRQSLEVRSRLARNLHDTVIQSIYAAGLGLENARSEIPSNPADASVRLEHCLKSLNDTIREVRSYITDLEPEAAGKQHFAQALRSLAYTMQSLWVANISLNLNEELATQFTSAQEMHILQIVREAISNALRHGEATQIEIALQPARDRSALLKVQDNGRGFDAAQRTGTGHGLVNMANRAKEMGASLRLQTEPGKGTVLVLRLPLPAPA